MNKLAIVVVGYNRIPGMLRLLDSLNEAEYFGDSVPLIISLDNSGNPEIVRVAEEFVWQHGEKVVRTFPERQGLRKHILSCGDYLAEYDAIAVLEDDLVVSPAFYNYMKQAVDYYKENDEVAGISLYSHKINVNVHLPFAPEPGAQDVFYLQFAQSWGQIWLKRQWFAFKAWYEENQDKEIAGASVPAYVSGWPKTSWLKYHIKYCIEKNLFFVYPYDSLTTCFSDVGEHCKTANFRFQTPMLRQTDKTYRFAGEKEQLCCYDAFFERLGLEQFLNVPAEQLCVDLYGAKWGQQQGKYLLTFAELPYEKLKSFGLQMRPQESNVIFGTEGTDLFLYDTECPRADKKGREKNYLLISYYYNITAGWRRMRDYIIGRIAEKFYRK